MSGPLEQTELVPALAPYVKRYGENMLLLIVFPILLSFPMFMLLLAVLMPLIQKSPGVELILCAPALLACLKIWLFGRYDKERSVANVSPLTILLSVKSKTFVGLLLRESEQEVGRNISYKTYKKKYIPEEIHHIWQDYAPANALNFKRHYFVVNLANYISLFLAGVAFLPNALNIVAAYRLSAAIVGPTFIIVMSPLILLGMLMLYLDIKVVTEFKDDLELAEIRTKRETFIGEIISESKDHVLLATVEKLSEMKLPTGLRWPRVEIEIPRKDISIIKRYILYKSQREVT